MKYQNKKQVKSLFDRYLSGTCTPEERQLVDNFLDSYQDDSREWDNPNFKLDHDNRIWQKINEQIFNEPKSKTIALSIKPWLRYAAIFIGVAVALFAYFRMEDRSKDILEIQSDMVVLQTNKGKNNLNENTTEHITDKAGKRIASVEKGVLKYNQDNSYKELIFNEIDVPLGRTFKLVLSDGTVVHLNAGTNLRYPVNFIPESKRVVFLSGEAYFEVTKNEANPFVVLADEMEVTVLGTHFNVSSYLGSKQHTVLVEGSVSIDNLDADPSAQRAIVIKPGQKAIMVPEGLNVNEVDVEDYIGWIRNLLIFNDELFPEIIEKIERKYNVEIENNFPELDTARFNGKFGNESIISLMNTFKESANFDYQIKDRRIIINKKQ